MNVTTRDAAASAVIAVRQAAHTVGALRALEEAKRQALIDSDPARLAEVTAQQQALVPRLGADLAARQDAVRGLAAVAGTPDAPLDAVIASLHFTGARDLAAELSAAQTALEREVAGIGSVSASTAVLLRQALRAATFMLRTLRAAIGQHAGYGPGGQPAPGPRRLMDQRG